ncbi:MAG: hypothetical protein JJ992_06180 [Planctomycetes bacterium]|nr:hypothetical protein [Planctomycetota bacterium]
MSHESWPPVFDDPSRSPEFRGVVDPSPPRGAPWRVVAMLGVVAALLIAGLESVPLEPRQGRLFLFAVPIAVATMLVLRLAFPWPWAKMWSHPDLLVPVGVVVGVQQLLGLLYKLPLLAALLAPQWSARLLGISLGLSLGAAVNVVLWTAFAAWQTDLLWRALRDGEPLDLSPWPSIRRHFLRTFVVLVIGVGVLLVVMVPILALGAVLFILAIPAIGALAIVWNLATAALLPVTLFHPGPLGPSLGAGFRVGWDLKGRWWRGLVVQLLLLGLIVLLRVHYTKSAFEMRGPGQGGSSVNTSVKWHVNAFWVGGYEHESRWYTKYADAIETSKVPLVTQCLGLLFLILAVAMKMTVMVELAGMADILFGQKPSGTIPPALPSS